MSDEREGSILPIVLRLPLDGWHTLTGLESTMKNAYPPSRFRFSATRLRIVSHIAAVYLRR